MNRNLFSSIFIVVIDGKEACWMDTQEGGVSQTQFTEDIDVARYNAKSLREANPRHNYEVFEMRFFKKHEPKP